MARLHILRQTSSNLYNVVVHAPTPNGNNLAGFTWAQAMAGAKYGQTTLEIGNGPGQITNAEANQVTSGALIEAPFAWGDDPNWTDQQRAADLEIRAGQAVNEAVERMQFTLRHFGRTVA